VSSSADAAFVVIIGRGYLCPGPCKSGIAVHYRSLGDKAPDTLAAGPPTYLVGQITSRPHGPITKESMPGDCL